MKKVLLVGTLAFALAGCGTNEDELTAVKEHNVQLQVQIEGMEEQLTTLKEQVDALASATQNNSTDEPEKVEAFTIQTLSTDGNSYMRTELTVEPEGEENKYEAMLRTLFPELLFNYVVIDADATITIDVHEKSTGSPHMTSSAQVGIFFDLLEYTLAENFPKLKGYYLTSNGESTYMGDAGPYEGLIPLQTKSAEDYYMPIKE